MAQRQNYDFMRSGGGVSTPQSTVVKLNLDNF